MQTLWRMYSTHTWKCSYEEEKKDGAARSSDNMEHVRKDLNQMVSHLTQLQCDT